MVKAFKLQIPNFYLKAGTLLLLPTKEKFPHMTNTLHYLHYLSQNLHLRLCECTIFVTFSFLLFCSTFVGICHS